MQDLCDYKIFHEFIARYRAEGFETIDRQDAWMVEMEKTLSHHNQFFYIADLLSMRVLFVSSGSTKAIGVEPNAFNLSSLFSRVHPDDFHRHSLARSMVIKAGYELMMHKGGTAIISTHSRARNATDNFYHLFFQTYSFYSEIPHHTVYTLVLLTDLSSFKIDTHKYHYYKGDDPAMFRYPDHDLLEIGHHFSEREFEIIKLIAAGVGSEQIADKLSLSVNTVNTHRRNILNKTRKSNTHDLVMELQERGIL